jgi:hypothetical protein
MWMRTLTLAAALAAVQALSGCAAIYTLNSDVSSYGQWPVQLKPGAYVFERLPSQQAQPEQQQLLEDAARPALEAAGFRAAANDADAEFAVQLGARVDASERSPFDDPFWWHGGLRYGGFGHRAFFGVGWGPFGSTPNYQREVGLLIRDRKTGQPLYEARASNDGPSAGINSLLSAMFEAALKDFPNSGPNPRRVSTQIPH